MVRKVLYNEQSTLLSIVGKSTYSKSENLFGISSLIGIGLASYGSLTILYPEPWSPRALCRWWDALPLRTGGGQILRSEEKRFRGNPTNINSIKTSHQKRL